MIGGIKMKNETTKKIIEFFKNNEEIFNSCIDDLDAYNGFLCDNRYYYMQDIDEFYSETNPLELLWRSFYGYDADSWVIDVNGDKIYRSFNPNREYFYFNGYGNLISTDHKDYFNYLDDNIIEFMNENRYYIDSIEENEELSELFDELEENEEEE